MGRVAAPPSGHAGASHRDGSRLTRSSEFPKPGVCVLPQALVMKVGMDSIMASYFALFEVINHSFGKNRRPVHAVAVS